MLAGKREAERACAKAAREERAAERLRTRVVDLDKEDGSAASAAAAVAAAATEETEERRKKLVSILPGAGAAGGGPVHEPPRSGSDARRWLDGGCCGRLRAPPHPRRASRRGRRRSWKTSSALRCGGL